MTGNTQQQQEAERSLAASPSFDEWENGNPATESSFEPILSSMFDSGSVSEDNLAAFMAANGAGVGTTSVPTSRVASTAEAEEDDVVVVAVAPPQQQQQLQPQPQQLRDKKREAAVMEDVAVPHVSRRRKKPKGMPKRGLSAYNLYFQRERGKIMDSTTDQKLSFEALGKIIGKRWKELPAVDREEYDSLATKDGLRYRKEMEVFNEDKKKRILHLDSHSEKNKIESGRVPTLPLLNTIEKAMPPLPLPPLAVPPPPRHQQRDSTSASGDVGAVYATPRDRYPPVYSGEGPPSPRDQRASYSSENNFPQHYYPPPPPLASSVPPREAPMEQQDDAFFPIPAGMELMLPDRDGRERKYRVQYACYTMTREAAQDYIDRLSGSLSRHSPPPPPPPEHRRVAGGGEASGAAGAYAGAYGGAGPPSNDRPRSWGNY